MIPIFSDIFVAYSNLNDDTFFTGAITEKKI